MHKIVIMMAIIPEIWVFLMLDTHGNHRLTNKTIMGCPLGRPPNIPKINNLCGLFGNTSYQFHTNP